MWTPDEVAAEISEYLSSGYVADVLAAVTPGWALVPVSDGAHVRLGGDPDLAPDEHWPTNGLGTRLTFVAQVDLGALPAIPAPWRDPRPPNARSGMLRLFADIASNPYEPGPAAALLVADAIALQPVAPPAPPIVWPALEDADPIRIDDDDRVLALSAQHLQAVPFLTLPEHLGSLTVFRPGDAVGLAYAALAEHLRQATANAGVAPRAAEIVDASSHLFGHPISVQADTRDGGPWVVADAPEPEAWTVVLGLHDGLGSLEILDAGAYHLLIPTADLNAGRWARLVCDIASG
jgi:hypothetical protein